MSHKNRHHGNKNNPNKMNENGQQAEETAVNASESQDSEDVKVVEAVPQDGEKPIEDGVEETDSSACGDAEKKIADLQAEVDKEKKEYLFLMAEFDNFRKRTLREKSEIIRNAGENVFKGLLPIMDDFERGIKAAENSSDTDSLKEGMILIYNKLQKYLNQNGVKEIDPADDTFDTEKHEAISVVPVPDESKKGKILDTVEKGYTINDKVLRHAKVVVGQ